LTQSKPLTNRHKNPVIFLQAGISDQVWVEVEFATPPVGESRRIQELRAAFLIPR
jgi:hypothetical protein